MLCRLVEGAQAIQEVLSQDEVRRVGAVLHAVAVDCVPQPFAELRA